jgi:hypothetical protein
VKPREVPLLDCMDEKELSKLAADLAKRGGPFWTAVRDFCLCKASAIRHRLVTGDVNLALALEARCDNIYRTHLRGRVDW